MTSPTTLHNHNAINHHPSDRPLQTKSFQISFKQDLAIDLFLEWVILVVDVGKDDGRDDANMDVGAECGAFSSMDTENEDLESDEEVDEHIFPQAFMSCGLKEVLAVMFENDNEHDFNLLIDMHTKLNDLGNLTMQRARSYIPRSPPTTYTDLFDDYMKKLSSLCKRGKIDTRDLPVIRRCDTTSVEEIRLKDGVIAKLNSRIIKLEAIIKVLGRERKGVSLDKSCVAKFFHNFSSGCWEELNEEFNELCETKFCVNRPTMIDLDSYEDLVQEYLIQEESRLKQDEEERCRLEEHKMMKALFLKTLQEKVQRCDEKEKMLKYEEEKKKRRHELMNLDHWKLYVSKISNGKRTQRSSAFLAYYWGNTFAMAEKDRPLNTLNEQDMNLFLKDVTPWVEDLSRYNQATDRVHLTGTFDIFLGRQGPLRSRRVVVNCIRQFYTMSLIWAMVGAYFVQLLLQDSIPSKAECSNCKFLAEKIKTLEAKIKILEGTLEMERNSENHTIESAAILHEFYNDMGKLGLE
ncbi:hypothetical protein Tco_0645562 [Tanacetum coccineum]